VRSSSSRLAIPLAIVFSFALVGASCSSKSTDATTTGTPAPGASKNDFSSLSGTLNGSGATFPAPYYEAAIEGFKEAAPQVTVNYAGGGSATGKQKLADGVDDYDGTDSLVADADKAKYKNGAFLYFPTVAAPITVSYNLPSVKDLKLSASTLAKIFQADIKTWDDPAIKTDNPGATLPSTPILVAHRAEGSGTTSNFTKYLKAAAPSDWKLEAADTVTWPAESQGGQGNAGVAQIVKGKEGAIGYVDFSDAKATGLTYAAIKNKDGQYVTASLDGASAALAGATVKDDVTYDALNAPGATAYPITAGTYIIIYQKQTDKTQGEAVKGFLTFILTDGQALAADVDFAKLPENIRAKAVAQLDKITIGA
jgi:phosphate transport system substrate-binding protein